jgi:hypothetical protein
VVDERIRGAAATPPADARSSAGERTAVAGRWGLTGGRVRRAAPCLVLVAIAMVLPAVHVARYHVLSPIDEVRHVDYAMRITHLELVRLGDKLGQEAMRAEACRGVDLPYQDSPCRTRHFIPEAFRDAGYQTASAHPPIYYLTVGLVARALVGVGLFHDFVDPARLMGGVFLAAGLVLTYLAGRRLGLRPWVLVAALALLPTTSAVLHAASIVNPDAVALLAGAIVVFAAVAWEQRRLSTVGLGAAGALATGLNTVNFLVVAVVAAWLVVRSPAVEAAARRLGRRWSAARPPDPERPHATPPAATPLGLRDRFTTAGLALVTGGVAAGAAWAFVDRVRATIDPAIVPQNRLFAAHGIPPLGVIFAPDNFKAWFPPVDGYEPHYFKTAATTDVQFVITVLVAGAMLAAVLRLARRDSLSVLGTVCTFIALAAAPGLVVVNVIVSNVVVGPEARYGMSLLPVMAIVLAASVRSRAGARVLGVFALTATVTVLVTMLAAAIPAPLVH